jgi:electron transfer flavoprotein beta subunit
MKILVTVKRVIDANVTIRIKADHSGVETANAKRTMNPFDETAVEEAVRLKEKGVATETVAITLGPAAAQETLRAALAMGIDRAIHVPVDTDVQSLGVARALKSIVEKEKPDLVLMGKQAIDQEGAQTGALLAALLGWAQGTVASGIEIEKDIGGGGKAKITREIDGGRETISIKLPAVVTADLRLNTPRFASLPNIMKARKKPIETIAAKDLGVDLTPTIQILKIAPPVARKGGIKVPDVATLVDKLRNEAKVIR